MDKDERNLTRKRALGPLLVILVGVAVAWALGRLEWSPDWCVRQPQEPLPPCSDTERAFESV